MSLPTAQKFAWSLAKTLMTCVVLIQTSDGYAVMTDAVWPAAGLMDTEIRCFIELEEQHATKEVQPRVQA
jgi:hypothetical protein